MAARISSSAKTRAGTRMSARAEAGISHVAASTLVSSMSDVEDDACPPAALVMHEPEGVVRGRLHERVEVGPATVESGTKPVLAQLEIGGLVRDERRRVGEVDELLQPGDEQRAAVRRLE